MMKPMDIYQKRMSFYNKLLNLNENKLLQIKN